MLPRPALESPCATTRLAERRHDPRAAFDNATPFSLRLQPADSSIAPLYYLIRRPTYILDFALTLTFNHILFTTYYAKAFPTSLYFWVVQALGAILMIVLGEQLCVKREMSSELDIAWNPGAEEIELGERR